MGFSPTRRECVLVTALLILLVLLSKSNHGTPSSSLSGENALPGFHQTELSVPAANASIPRRYRTHLTWGAAPVPQTKVLAHVPGWTIFDRLYILNGTVYIVNDDPLQVPDRATMTSTSLDIKNGAVEEDKRVPTDKEMRIVSTKEARVLFGLGGAEIIDGVTWLGNDPPQFITHYYHWAAEIFFGFWRTYSSLDPQIDEEGKTTLPPPRRLMFKRLDSDHWRDYAAMNQWIVRSSFPGVTFEFEQDWADRAAHGKPFVLDRVVLADRSAAMLGFNFHRTQRTASEAFVLPGSVHWWSTIRNNVVQAAGLRSHVGGGTTSTHVITYISRQSWGRRMLIQEDHEGLVRELYKLRDEHGYEVNVVSMDKMSRKEQLQLAGRTTIMMGVHGNGLTSLLWMNPNPRSTVMEFFFPGGFAHDYEYTTRALGMVHYGFWGKDSFTSPGTPDVLYPEGFQGNEIPIDGAAVARLCHARLTLEDEADD